MEKFSSNTKYHDIEKYITWDNTIEDYGEGRLFDLSVKELELLLNVENTESKINIIREELEKVEHRLNLIKAYTHETEINSHSDNEWTNLLIDYNKNQKEFEFAFYNAYINKSNIELKTFGVYIKECLTIKIKYVQYVLNNSGEAQFGINYSSNLYDATDKLLASALD